MRFHHWVKGWEVPVTLTLMRVSNRQAAVRNHSTLTAGDVGPRGTNHSSRYERTPNGVERTSLWDETSSALLSKSAWGAASQINSRWSVFNMWLHQPTTEWACRWVSSYCGPPDIQQGGRTRHPRPDSQIKSWRRRRPPSVKYWCALLWNPDKYIGW